MNRFLKLTGRILTNAIFASLVILSANQLAYSASNSQKLIPILAVLLFDGQPLEVDSHVPISNENNVSRGVVIQITFSANLDATTLDATSVTLTSANNTVAHTLSVTDNILSITPDSVLALGTIYTVTLQDTIEDIEHNQLKDIYSWQFTTTALNSAPTASNVLVTDDNGGNAEFGDILGGSYSYFDVDGDAEGASIVQWIRNGSAIAGSTGVTSYVLVAADNGAQIQYSVQPVAAAGTTTGVAVVSPAIQVVNSPAPVAVADSGSTNEDTPTNINAAQNDTDADNNIDVSSIDLNMSIAGIQNNYTDAVGNQWSASITGIVTFTPALNINGTQVTAYTIHDTDGLESLPASISVTVNPVNDAPVAVADTTSTPENTSVLISVISNDTDVDGNLDIASVDLDTVLAGRQISKTDASGNAWSVDNSGVVTFSPATNYYGTATLPYTISDSNGVISPAANINVTIQDPAAVNGTVYRSCAHALQQGENIDGVYRISADGIAPAHSVYCDQTTDNGGWTLVGSTLNTTLNDESSPYYTDLARLAPGTAHTGIWDGLRSLGDRWDVRFTCRDNGAAPASDPMLVDLSFYDTNWYDEFTTGTDADSCFSENNGTGADSPVPARRNNLNQSFRRKTDRYNSGYLEAEDSCSDTGDFTVDFDDRGLDSDQSDGTDWGEDDGLRKCGTSGLLGGQWFVYTRERPRVAVIGLASSTTTTLRDAGILADQFSFNSTLAANITTERYDTVVIGRYASTLGRLDQSMREALAIFGRNGGNIVTEWEGASVFMDSYAAGFRYIATAPTPLGWFDAEVSGGDSVGYDTPVTITAPSDPIFQGVSNPIQAASSTEYFLGLNDLNPPAQILGHEVLATFPGGIAPYPDATYPAITRGRYCGGQFISANFDWQDGPTDAGLGPLIPNMVKNASTPSPADLNEACPVQQRIHYGVCGSSILDPATIGLTGLRQNTCVPSDTMQAMLITRTGIINNYTALQTYVRNGGIVVTEYDNADTVYSGMFGGTVVQGTRYGDCQDNIMPLVQESPENGFWQENLFEPPAANREGCGMDLSAFSGITKLGGWTDTTTQIAYRDLGEGRVWLVASDWQDASGLSQQSMGLMRYMVTHSAGGLYGRGSVQSGVQQYKSMDSYLDDNFTPCLTTDYASTVSLADIQNACSGDTLVLACRPVGSSSLQVAAMGDRTQVLFDVGIDRYAVNPHNGVNWYYSPIRSWGFAPGGEAVNRNSCDTTNSANNDRICWHTSADNLASGYRCGDSGGINGNTNWERIILHRDGDVPL